MSLISNTISRIKPSATIEIAMLTHQLREQGKKITSFGIGETDFRVPEYVDEGAINAIKQGNTKYPPLNGFPELKEAIIKKFQRDNELTYKPEQIMVCNGVKQALYNLLSATINPGDEVIILAPYWVSYIDMVKIVGGIPVIIPCSYQNNFKVKAADLEKAITTKTKWLIFNSPTNPTGSCYNRDEIKSITDVLIKHQHVHLISDDIYEHIIYDETKFYTPAQVEPKLFDRVFTVNGFSKAYAMTGWRVGYIGGSADVIKAMSVIQSQSTSGVCSIAQQAALAALNGDQEILKARTRILNIRRDIALEIINSTNHLQAHRPKGAFYLFVSCNNILNRKTKKGFLIENDKDFAKYLLEDFQVAVVPGEAFGMPNFFRLSYVLAEQDLINGCNNIINACKDLM